MGDGGRARRGPGRRLSLRGRARLLGALCLWFPPHRPCPNSSPGLLSAYADQLAMASRTHPLREAENKRTQLEQVFASTSDASSWSTWRAVCSG